MPGPLEGLRVIDFGQYLAGPFGPMLLADLGADVIKVEPTRGDGMRSHVVGSFMGCQRGKRDIALDLKQPEGLRIALELVAGADIVHHNMTSGPPTGSASATSTAKRCGPTSSTATPSCTAPPGHWPIWEDSTRWVRRRRGSSGSKDRSPAATPRCGTATAMATSPRPCRR
jgi:hypothetical protein